MLVLAQASEEEEFDLYAAPQQVTDASDDEMMDGVQQRIATAPDQQAAEDALMETASVLSPPDSQTTTGGLGTADAAVSLAINCTTLLDKPGLALQNGAASKAEAVSSALGEQSWPRTADAIANIVKDEEPAPQQPGLGNQRNHLAPVFVMGSDAQPIPPTPVHHRRGSRPSTPQRNSPSDSSMLKVRCSEQCQFCAWPVLHQPRHECHAVCEQLYG